MNREVAGEVVIEIKADSKQFQKDLKKQIKELEGYQKEAEELTTVKEKYEADVKAYEKRQKEIAKTREEVSSLRKEYDALEEKLNELYKPANEEQIRKNLAENPEIIEKRNALLTQYNAKKAKLYSYETEGLGGTNAEIEEEKKLLDDINQKLSENNQKQQLIKQSVIETKQEILIGQQAGAITNAIKGIGKQMKDITQKAVRWGLAIFGIRGAYMAVRNAINVISRDDEQLKADIDYMKNAIAYVLEPIVRRIIDWAKQLLFYIAYIIKIWTGKNIFENANKSLQKADKSAKSLQKTLAGFDEMNILNDNGSVGVVGATPDFDLSSLSGVSMPDWIYWIAQNKDIVLGFVQALIVGLTALKYGAEGIMMLGIGVAILSVINLVRDLITFINDPSWQNFRAVLESLTNVIIGVGIAMIGLEASNPAGWIVLAIGVIGNFITKLFEEKDATEKLTVAKDRLNQAEREFINAQTTYVDAIKRRDEALNELKAIEEKTHESGEALYNLVVLQGKAYDDLEPEQKDVYLAYLKYKGALDDVDTATEKLQEKEKKHITEIINMKAETAKATGNFEDLGKTINELVKNGKLTTKEAAKLLKDTYKDLDREGKKTFKEQMPTYIDASTQATKELSKELAKIANQYDAINNKARAHSFSASTSTWGVNGYAKGGIVPTIKLASGAIINKPSTGVPVGGERGAEGVVPLTDSQQMELLGEAIGKFVNIQANIPVYVGNRLVTREMKRISAEDDFAYNR